MRRAAKILHVHPVTVTRKLRFLADQERKLHREFLERVFGQDARCESIQFDDMETFEHSKCKPLSIPVVVQPETRKILGLGVARMPAKGKLSRIALKKYGPRFDERARVWNELLNSLKPFIDEKAHFRSDQNPHYPSHLKKYFPNSEHETYKGRRGCVVGQGELKRGGFDPLFSLNHTCAMIRANLNRLFRRTWCTTKKAQSLADHLALYIGYHNRILTA